MSTERADLEVNLNGNKHGLSQMLREASKEVSSFAKETTEEVSSSWSLKSIAAGALGFFGLEQIKSMVEGFLGRMSEIKNMSEEIGISADEMERWGIAAENAGGSMEQISRVLSQIQEKRLQAANDPKMASLFQNLGVSREDVLNTEGVNVSQLVAKMGVNREDDLTRKMLYELVGPRGYASLRGAAGRFPTTKAETTDAEREEAHKEETQAKKAGRTLGHFFTRSFLGFWSVFNGDAWRAFRDSRGWTPQMHEDFIRDQAATKEGAPAVVSAKAAQHEAEKLDPLKAYYDDLELKHAEKMADLNERLRESSRGLLTVGERRKDIEAQIAELAKDILDAETDPALFNTYATQEEVAKWRIKEAELRKQLIERPTEWQTKAAAFAAVGGTTFGGAAQAHQQLTNKLLDQIHQTIQRNGTF